VRACKYLRGHVHTFQPFIDLLTRHSSVLSLLLPLFLYPSFSLRRYVAPLSKELIALIEMGRGLDEPVSREFRHVARHEAECSTFEQSLKASATFIDSGSPNY